MDESELPIMDAGQDRYRGFSFLEDFITDDAMRADLVEELKESIEATRVSEEQVGACTIFDGDEFDACVRGREDFESRLIVQLNSVK